MTVYLNIGGNQGDRQALIEQAVALIAEAYPGATLRRSDYIESEPWGYSSPNKFLNLGVAVDVLGEVEPYDVLKTTQSIEKSISAAAHRNADGSYRDRQIDIDIIAIDTIRINDFWLTLPHPQAHLRPFVMIPLEQLAPPAVVWWVKTTLARRNAPSRHYF